jgi:ferredoxin
MAMRIRSEECTGCRLCVEICPVCAIVAPGAGEPTNAFRVVPGRCTECVGDYARPRCAALCPADCIETDLDHLEGRETLVRKWQALAHSAPSEALVPGSTNGPAEYGDPDA